MKLTLEVVSKDFFGIFTVHALIDEKPYTFVLNSEYAIRQVQKLIRQRRPGRALNMLKKFNVKLEKINCVT
jgi:hypothetical protein